MGAESKQRRIARRIDEENKSNTLSLPLVLRDQGVAEGGSCRRYAHALRSIDGQELYQKYAIKNPDRAGERVHPDKKYELDAQFIFGGSYSIPQESLPRKEVRYSHQEEIGATAGCHRSTVSRAFKRAKLIAAERSFHGYYRYRTLLPEGPAPDKFGKNARWTKSVDALAKSDLPVKFAAMKRKKSGYFNSQPFTHDPNLRDPRTGKRMKKGPRKALWICQAWDLLQKKDSRVIDQITVPLQEMAKDISVRPETLRRNLVPWELLGLIRVIQPPPEQREDGSEWWPPVTIIWLPTITLHLRAKALEEKRLIRMKMRRGTEHTWWRNVAKIHEELLKHASRHDWLLRDFWTECRRRMAADRVPESIIDLYIPRPPD